MSPIWLTVLHTPRRPIYLESTCAALDVEGAAVLRMAGILRTIVCVDRAPDSAPPRIPAGWEHVTIGEGRGTRYAMLHTIRAAAIAGAASLIYCEDDIIPCARAVVGLAELTVPEDLGFIAACDVRSLAGAHVEPARLVRRAADDPALHPGFWGSQALVIPDRALAHLRTARIDASDPNHPNASDVWIGDQLASAGAPWQKFGVIGPSLFQHVGAHSTIDPGWTLEPHRVAASWRQDMDGQAVVRAIGHSLRRRAPF